MTTRDYTPLGEFTVSEIINTLRDVDNALKGIVSLDKILFSSGLSNGDEPLIMLSHIKPIQESLKSVITPLSEILTHISNGSDLEGHVKISVKETTLLE